MLEVLKYESSLSIADKHRVFHKWSPLMPSSDGGVPGDMIAYSSPAVPELSVVFISSAGGDSYCSAVWPLFRTFLVVCGSSNSLQKVIKTFRNRYPIQLP